MALTISGEKMIPASRETVWSNLNDPEVLRLCIPGCTSLERRSETDFEAVLRLKIGPISASFKALVALSDLNPPESYTITGRGGGGLTGKAKGVAKVRLSETSRGTHLSYDVDGIVEGNLAKFGMRLIDSAARRLADQFFDNFAGRLAAPSGA